MCLIAGLLALAVTSSTPNLVEVSCRVFHDLDADGVEDAGEPPMAGVRLTNGVDLLTTDSAGSSVVTVDLDLYRFVTLTIPAGYWPTTPWWILAASAPDTVVFGLRTAPETASDPIRWVHITDTQTQTWGDPNDLVADLEAINDLPDPPLFLVNTGDLVETGSDTTHFENYVDQIATSNAPVFAVVGNHDIKGVTPPLAHYEKYVGPPYYEFAAGSWRFVAYNNELPNTGTPAQDGWLDAVLDASQGEHVVVMQHRMLAQLPSSLASDWAARGVVATFSGHWHGLSFSEHRSGILDFNLSRTSVGPLDRTPRVFSIVTMGADGTIDCALRRVDVDHRVEITHPQPEHVLGDDLVEVLVQAYDTSSPVVQLAASVPGAGAPLSREGVSLWRGVVNVSAAPPGPVTVTVDGSFLDGWPIHVQVTFERGAATPIASAAGADWPMFRKCPAGSSFVATPLPPPLALRWATLMPGMVALSSPVVAGGRVYLGTRTETGDPAGSAVTCCDAATGAILWSTPVPGGIALAPAVAGGVVVASSMADSIVALDAASGQRLWSLASDGMGYKMAAAIVDGGTAWVGSEPAALQIAVASGQIDWTSSVLGHEWHPGIYSAPAVSETAVHWAFYGTSGQPPDGYSIVDRAGGSATYQENGVYRSALCAGDTVFVAGGTTLLDHFLSARDASGQVLWTSPTNIGYTTASPALGRGVLVIAGRAGRVRGFRASDGADLWEHSVGPSLYDMSPNRRRQRDTVGTAAIADDVCWIGSLDGNLYALDLATGAELWRWSLGTPVASSPAVSGMMLFVGASDGHLYAFVTGAPPTVDAPHGAASHFALYLPRPNPARGAVHLEWVLPARARVRIEAFDVGGRYVASILDEERDAGEGFAVWDGRTDHGERAGPGVYFLRLRAGDREAVQKVVRLLP